jgi:hypothetical protein
MLPKTNPAYTQTTASKHASRLGKSKKLSRNLQHRLRRPNHVKTIAEMVVVEEMKLKNVKLKLTGEVDGGRGWKASEKKIRRRRLE